MLKGIDVVLYDKYEVDSDAFGHTIVEEYPIVIHNVLVAPASSDDIVTSTNLVGKQAHYTLGIPKGDYHIWENRIVEFFGKKYRTYGFTIKGIESMVPTKWHHKVMCELYE